MEMTYCSAWIIVWIKTEHVSADIERDVEPKCDNWIVIEAMKSKLDGKIMMKDVGMRPNMYLTNSYLTDDNFVVKKRQNAQNICYKTSNLTSLLQKLLEISIK